VISLRQEDLQQESRMKNYKGTLTEEEREELGQLINQGQGAARKLLHARIRLKADSSVGWQDPASRAA